MKSVSAGFFAFPRFKFQVLSNLSIINQNYLLKVCLNYWCETEEQKKDFIKKLNENEILYEEELKKKYDIENIFKSIKSNNKLLSENKVSMIEYKQTVFQKILSKIKRLFNIK